MTYTSSVAINIDIPTDLPDIFKCSLRLLRTQTEQLEISDEPIVTDSFVHFLDEILLLMDSGKIQKNTRIRCMRIFLEAIGEVFTATTNGPSFMWFKPIMKALYSSRDSKTRKRVGQYYFWNSSKPRAIIDHNYVLSTQAST